MSFTYDRNWAKVDINAVPRIVTPPPGPQSQEMHGRAARYMKGYSSQVRLFPVVFQSGKGCTLTDVDGNVYIDFSSGIYVTGLGHCHPKVTEAVQRAAGELMNAHDFTTPIKMKLLEKLAEITPGEGKKKLNGMQLYDSGTTAVEAGLRVMRAATGKFEFISFHRDFHGKTMGAVGLARLDVSQGLRAPGLLPGAARLLLSLRVPPDLSAVQSALRGLHPHGHQGGRPPAAWRASCWSRSRVGPAASCRLMAGSRRSGRSATNSASC